MGFFPLNQGLTSPTPYPSEPCPFHSTLHCRSWLWFILINVRVYMMPNYNVPDSMRFHRQLPYCRNIHNQIDGGAFSLSSSPWLITIYTSCKWGQNRGHYIEAVDTIANIRKIYRWAEYVTNMLKGICEKCQESGGIIRFPSLMLWIVMYSLCPVEDK